MGIFSRLGDIINSNINDVLDRAEDPAKMIRLVIQEMEDTLVEVRSSAAKTIADRKELERRRKRLEEMRASWDEKAELALSKGREDLAKGALVEKAKLSEMAKALAEELDILADTLRQYGEDVEKLEAKLREAKAKQAALLARHATANNRLKLRQQLYDNRAEDALLRFERLERRVEVAEGRVDAYDLGKVRTLDDAFAELAAEEAVGAELDALKQRLASKAKASSGEKA